MSEDNRPEMKAAIFSMVKGVLLTPLPLEAGEVARALEAPWQETASYSPIARRSVGSAGTACSPRIVRHL